MATFQTYQAIGIREDLNDVITTISPLENWVTKNTKDGPAAQNTYVEWQTDALAAAAANAAVEGADASPGTITATTRLGNYTQIVQKSFQISNTQTAVKTAGRKDELDYQTTKHLKELARDIEYALVINSASASGASGTARQLKGMIGFISTNATAATSANSASAATETLFNDTLQTIWAAGGEPEHVLCGSVMKRAIDGWTTNTRQTDAEGKKLTTAVDVYQSSFGDLKIRLHRQINTTVGGTTLILGDMSHWQKRWLRPTKRIELAVTGDSVKYQVIGELSLECRAENGHGKLTGFKAS